MTVVYAGGGGGAYVNANNTTGTKRLGGAGGTGGGGNGAGVDGGATGKELNPVPAGNGADGLGGGGGGGVSHDGAAETAGNGGNGVVIIRLSGFVVSKVPLPVPHAPFTYDGNAHTGVVEFYAYKLEGTPVAVNADVYSVTATIKPEYPFEWGDAEGGKGPRTVWWRINQRRVNAPEITKQFIYDATEHCAVDKARYHLDSDGYCYTDEGLKYCLLTQSEKVTEKYKATNATNYTFSAKLIADYESVPNVTNFVWSNGQMLDRTYQWSILQATNRIENFTYGCYRLDRLDLPSKAHHPTKHFTSPWGFSTAVIEYRPVGTEGDGGWETWPPKAKGSYTLRITIPETANWQGDVVTKDFGTWKTLADIFTDQMEVTVSGNTSTETLSNFPVPVRVHEPERDGYEAFSGFSYARAGSTGKEVRFFDKDGDPIEHEVDTWNIYDESILWVRVPTLRSTGTKVTMCWRRNGDIMLPEYNPAAVWNKVYAGVWHFAKQEDGVWADSSGNERHARLEAGAKVKAIDAKLGKGLYVEKGNVVADDWPYGPGTLTNRFTYTGWYRYPDYAVDSGFNNDKPIGPGNRLFAGLMYDADTINNAKKMDGWALRMGNLATTVNWMTSQPSGQDWSWAFGANSWNMQETWGYLGYKANYKTPTAGKGAGIARYYAYNGTLNEGTQEDINYYVNGSDKPLQLATIGFEVDEVRFTTTALSKAWMEQEFRTLYVQSYCTYGLIKIDCDRYNNGSGLICDYWTSVPSLGKTTWHVGESFPTESKCTYKGAGTAITPTYRMIPNGEPSKTRPTAPGYYRAIYDHTSPASYRPQAHTIDFYIIERTVPVYDIGGSGGDSGRILLMNADNNASGPVTNQGWCAQDDSGVTYWRTLSASAGTNNVKPGTEFALIRSADTNVLWHLIDCCQGNTFPTNDTTALSTSLCYLPSSSATALSITNEDVKATRSGTGWLLMRNVECPEQIVDEFGANAGACVYSSCYSNGIGTVYFDAVNGRKSVAGNADSYRLVLEIATENVDGLPPTDENSYTTDGVGHTLSLIHI